jgi:hypothetical protein
MEYSSDTFRLYLRGRHPQRSLQIRSLQGMEAWDNRRASGAVQTPHATVRVQYENELLLSALHAKHHTHQASGTTAQMPACTYNRGVTGTIGWHLRKSARRFVGARSSACRANPTWQCVHNYRVPPKKRRVQDSSQIRTLGPCGRRKERHPSTGLQLPSRCPRTSWPKAPGHRVVFESHGISPTAPQTCAFGS